ncbi:MAG: hypothetical protein KDN22_21785 [Verrucomicrobiae bacterium]|nr:hypothetical protein [Verrucomicrobiae bacterium]
MTEEELIAKLEKIERLFAGATTPGERNAASEARQRIQSRLETLEPEEPVVEFRFTMTNEWSRRLFSALVRRHGLRPFRYKNQRYTTVMVWVSKRFVDETLWPEFEKLDDILTNYLSSITDNLINKHIHKNSGEADVVDAPERLEG